MLKPVSFVSKPPSSTEVCEEFLTKPLSLLSVGAAGTLTFGNQRPMTLIHVTLTCFSLYPADAPVVAPMQGLHSSFLMHF